MSDIIHASKPNQVAYRAVSAKEGKKYHAKFGKTLRINRKDYALIFCQTIVLDGAQVIGLCDPGTHTIYIDVHSPNIEETLIHEIIHAEFVEGGFRQRNSWDDDLEEQICELVAQAISYSFSLKLCKR